MRTGGFGLEFAQAERGDIASSHGSFPADIVDVHSPKSLAPGQAALLRVTLTNNS